MNRIAVAAFCTLLVAACARSEPASDIQPASNQGYNQVAKVGTPDQDDREPAIGEWRASLQENAQALEFGPMGTEPLFSLLCAGNRNVLMQRHGGAPAGPLPAIQISVGDVTARLPVTAGGATIPMLRAEVPLDTPVLNAFARSGQPLMVRIADGAALVIPASPLIGDYLRTCATAAAPAAAGNSMGNTVAPAPEATNQAAPAAPGNAAQPSR